MQDVERHRQADLASLLIAVVCASTAAPFMAAADAPSLGIAFWRNALAALVLLPMLARHRAALGSLSRRQWIALVSAGAFLGIHFSGWVPSVKLTSVAAAASLVSTQVVWAALLDRFTGGRPPRMQFIGIATTLVGVIWLTGVDFALEPRAIMGDLLALGGAVAAAAYMHVGQGVRPHLPLSAYTAVLYLSASITLLVICAGFGVPLVGYAGSAWMYIAAVTLFAQFGGHTLYNKALRSFSATAVSNVILLQVPIGATIAWLLLHQVPSVKLLPAAVLIVTGVIVVIRSERRATVDIDGQAE